MPRRRTIASLGALALAGAAVNVSSAVGSPSGKKSLSERVSGCMQTHRSSTEDDLGVTVTVDENGNVVKKRKHHRKRRHHAQKAAVTPAGGATVSATLTGPYVTNGHVSGTTDATGTAALTLMISGPGTYTLSLSATKAGDTPASVTKTITVSGPVNAPCNIS